MLEVGDQKIICVCFTNKNYCNLEWMKSSDAFDGCLFCFTINCMNVVHLNEKWHCELEFENQI